MGLQRNILHLSNMARVSQQEVAKLREQVARTRELHGIAYSRVFYYCVELLEDYILLRARGGMLWCTCRSRGQSPVVLLVTFRSVLIFIAGIVMFCLRHF